MLLQAQFWIKFPFFFFYKTLNSTSQNVVLLFMFEENSEILETPLLIDDAEYHTSLKASATTSKIFPFPL